MIELTTAKNVLNHILFEHQDFKIALKTELSSKRRYDTSDFRNAVSKLVISELRHHVLFKTILEKIGQKFTTEDLCFIYLLFTCKYFYQEIDYAKVCTDVKAFLKKDKYLPLEDVLKFDDPYDYLALNTKSVKYLSCQYNIPSWIIELWKEQYGPSFTIKIAHALSKPRELTYRVNSLFDNVQQVLKANNDIFNKTETEYIYSAKQKDLLRAVMPNDFVFAEDVNIKNIVDCYENDFLNELTIYSGSDDVLPLELFVRSKLQTGINVVCPFFEEKANFIRFCRAMNAHNVNAFKAHEVITMRTGISRPTEIVYCNPRSSSFGKINSKPDYLVHLRMPSLKEMIKYQKEAIENCSKFVCEDGLLIYIVDTINKNETINIVSGFVSKHPEFKIIEEEQLYPQSSKGSTLYYAVLKMEKTND